MTKTLSFIPILEGAEVNVLDDKIKLLVNANIDCFVDEKQRLVVHPDQYEKAIEAIK